MPHQVHVIKNADGAWSLKHEGRGGDSSLHRTQAEAAAAGRRVAAEAGGAELVIHRADGGIRDRDTVPPTRRPDPVDRGLEERLLTTGAPTTSRAPRTEGPRTTLRVPEALARIADAVAQELGVSRNDALLRLATRGALLYEQERSVAERRDRRWSAVLAGLRDLGEGDFPSPEAAQAAVLDARDHAAERSR